MQRRGFFKSLLGIGVAAKVAPEVLKVAEAPAIASVRAQVPALVARVAHYGVVSSTSPLRVYCGDGATIPYNPQPLAGLHMGDVLPQRFPAPRKPEI